MSNVIKENLKYTEDHEWVKIDGDIVTFGITDFAQSSLGDIVFLELPELDTVVDKNSACGVIESIKAVNDLCAPVSGTIVEINSEVEDAPENCNSDAYNAWLIKIKINNNSDFENLMDAKQYQEHCTGNN